MGNSDLIAVVGATGRQGGAAARALLDAGYRVRALTRDPDSAAVSRLEERGARVVRADLRDQRSVESAFAGAAGVYAMTTPRDGIDVEIRQGEVIGNAAAAAGVRHVVYSSSGGAERSSGIPHFESKFAVEGQLASLGLAVTVLRPVFFYENLLGAQREDGRITIALPLPDGIPIEMIATDDIGRVAAAVMLSADWQGRSLEIAGDRRTGSEIAEIFGRAAGVPARYQPQPLSILEDEDNRRMFAWFAETDAYRADFGQTRLLDPDVLTLDNWLRRNKCKLSY